MSDYPRFTINRALVAIVPEQPFLDWIRAVDPEPVPNLTLEHVREDQSVFLLPEELADTTDSARHWVEKRWRSFFEFMLAEWFDESLWPEKLSLAMFRDWFSLHYHSTVFDMVADTPLMHDDHRVQSVFLSLGPTWFRRGLQSSGGHTEDPSPR